MSDWKKAAAAFAPDMPEDAVERAAKALDTLESVFRPAAAKIPQETEPAYTMKLEEEAR
jgi:hypothetical protein